MAVVHSVHTVLSQKDKLVFCWKLAVGGVRMPPKPLAGHDVAQLILLSASSSVALANSEVPKAKMLAEEGLGRNFQSHQLDDTPAKT